MLVLMLDNPNDADINHFHFIPKNGHLESWSVALITVRPSLMMEGYVVHFAAAKMASGYL
jgi:hypothetical protein